MRVLLKLLFDAFNRKAGDDNELCLHYDCNTCPDGEHCYHKAVEELKEELREMRTD